MSIRGISAVKRFMDRRIPGCRPNAVRSIGILQGCFALAPVFAFSLFLQASPYQKQEADAGNTPSALTEEEKEIIKDREMLENLTLLQNLDTIEYIDLLNEMEPDWPGSGESDDPKGKKEEGNKP